MSDSVLVANGNGVRGILVCMGDGLPFSREELLGQTAWLHGLARSLATQTADADDATQETCLQALRQPPREARSWRPFLATTLRNTFALTRRAERRRADRERHVAASPDATSESTADLVARLELHRHLAGLVLALPEPQRELVLRHYFAGDSITDLAQHTGTTSAAVRGHLHRARARLRQQLEAADGRARRGFALLLTAMRPSVVPITLAVVGITMKTKLVVAAAAVVIAGLCVWQVSAPPADPGVVVVASSGAPATAPLADVDQVVAPSTVLRTEADPARVVCQLVGLQPDVPWHGPFTVKLSGVDPAGRRRSAEQGPIAPDATGRFGVTLPDWTATCTSFVANFEARVGELYLPVDLDVPSASLAASPLVANEVYEIPVEVVSVLTGSVVDEQGVPICCAKVFGCLTLGSTVRFRSPRADTHAVDGTFALQVPAQAEVALIAIALDEFATLPTIPGPTIGSVATLDHGKFRRDLLPGWVRVAATFGKRTEAPPIVLRKPVSVHGTIAFADGTPAAGASISVGTAGEDMGEVDLDLVRVDCLLDGLAVPTGTIVKSDADGRFEFTAPRGREVFAGLRELAWGGPFLHAGARTTAPGSMTLTVPGVRTSLCVLSEGRPVAGARIHVHLLPDGRGNCWTDALGQAHFMRDPTKEVPLHVCRGGAASVSFVLPVARPGEEVVSLEVPPVSAVPVRITCRGAPQVRALKTTWTRLDTAAMTSPIEEQLMRANAAGLFSAVVPPGRYRLGLLGPRSGGEDSFLIGTEHEVEVGARGGDFAVDLVHGGRIRFLVRDRQGLPINAMVRLITPAGVELRPSISDGRYGVPGLISSEAFPASTGNLAPGRHEVVLDLHAHGIHRRSVEVKAHEIVDGKVTVE